MPWLEWQFDNEFKHRKLVRLEYPPLRTKLKVGLAWWVLSTILSIVWHVISIKGDTIACACQVPTTNVGVGIVTEEKAYNACLAYVVVVVGLTTTLVVAILATFLILYVSTQPTSPQTLILSISSLQGYILPCKQACKIKGQVIIIDSK